MKVHIDGLEVFFPYDYIYKEQFQYMVELKRAIDAKGDAILEMPTGTGKTVSLLALITSYQYAYPDSCGKLIYCTRTVPEMTKTIRELKRVVEYREKVSTHPSQEILAVCLSSRRNMCIHPTVSEESERETVDSACRNLTASWVRAKAETDSSVELCQYFEEYEKSGTDADIRGIYSIEDLKELGKEKGWCPYFLTRHVINYANVVVYNYQYMLDPKVAGMVTRELEDKSIVVFDEGHNIDNVCIEALSITLNKRMLSVADSNLNKLDTEVKRMKEADSQRLQDEYQRLVQGLSNSGAFGDAHPRSSAQNNGNTRQQQQEGTGGGEEMLAAPVLPQDVVEEALPGNIRNAELFVRYMKQVVRFLRQRIGVEQVESETPQGFLQRMGNTLQMDTEPLKFAYSRLNSLMKTLQITDVDEFSPLQLVADFATLICTYSVGFMVILEPFNSQTPHIPDPVLQLACLDASLAVKPVFDKFQSVIITSGTLSPLDMYSRMLNFRPVVQASLEMSITRPCICPMMITRGSDQTPLSTKYETRDDETILRHYGSMVEQMCSVVPDGAVVFFPSYSYMEMIVSKWYQMGTLTEIEKHKLLFIETKDIYETTLALNNFKRACDIGRGAVFFSVARGKVAEGIDFEKHYGRLVILIGIPFQYTLSHVLRARLVYLRDTFRIKEQDFLTFDAIRQSAQCVGRVIRSKKDYGVMVFADSRYARYDKRSKLPQWVTQFLPEAHLNLTVDMSKLLARKFLKEMAQPLPQSAAFGTSLLTEEDIRNLTNQGSESAQAGVGYLNTDKAAASLDDANMKDSRHALSGVKRPKLEDVAPEPAPQPRSKFQNEYAEDTSLEGFKQ
eukprot:gb/GECG01012161.1/.p1 GENE.gb/GECG01012161.1/~~gb/GECG01012161.1/.p1  ORF type:complete len:845 (+),score=112.20 gb/GECG01012161.1/:1-2535(+)